MTMNNRANKQVSAVLKLETRSRADIGLFLIALVVIILLEGLNNYTAR